MGADGSDTSLFQSDGSSLSNWTVSGATVDSTVGNPSPSLKATGGNYAYYDLGTSFVSKIISFDVYIINSGAHLCNFPFAVNSSGSGSYLRIEGRTNFNSGIGQFNSWTSWGNPTATANHYSLATWHSVVITIDSQAKASWSINGTTIETNKSVSSTNTFFAIHGDASIVGGGNFDNIIITEL